MPNNIRAKATPEKSRLPAETRKPKVSVLTYLREPSRLQDLFRDLGEKSWQEVQETRDLLRWMAKIARGKTATAKEREQALEQVKDLVRMVPAFAIFMLPGGTLLLTLAARYLPWRIIPSAFVENKAELKALDPPAQLSDEAIQELLAEGEEAGWSEEEQEKMQLALSDGLSREEERKLSVLLDELDPSVCEHWTASRS